MPPDEADREDTQDESLPEGPSASALSGLEHTLPSTSYVPVNPTLDDEDDDEERGSRYEPLEILGEGGMGKVRLCKDRRIGREVALKEMRRGSISGPDRRARFVREARVQGQLEHPSVVPVYDLSLRPDPAFFTMRRVRGETLERVLERLRTGDRGAAASYSLHKLLAAFASVCLAVDYAHAHGVVHRDLKPANVMLGGFGEVYVLDWGIAKVAPMEDVATDEPIDTRGEGDVRTSAGTLMGTLGYMPPEQIRGEATARCDLYALGATLFEILTLRPLHEGGRMQDVLASTQRGADTRASVRAPERDVPPELEAICAKATALSPADRYASARELHDAVERFLAGGRDEELRRSLARQHIEAASRAAERALAAPVPEATAQRSTALREVGRALALDPRNSDALRTLVHLLVEPPRDPPAVAVERVERARTDRARTVALRGSVAYAAWAAQMPLLLLMGIREWLWTALIFGAVTSAALLAWLLARRSAFSSGRFLLVAAIGAVANGLSARWVGPYFLLPAVLIAQVITYTFYPHARARFLAIAFACLGFVTPVILQVVGVLAPSYDFVDGFIRVIPHWTSLTPGPTTAYALFTTVVLTFCVSLLIGGIRREQFDAELKLQVQTWQLEQLVPEPVRTAGAAPTAM